MEQISASDHYFEGGDTLLVLHTQSSLFDGDDDLVHQDHAKLDLLVDAFLSEGAFDLLLGVILQDPAICQEPDAGRHDSHRRRKERASERAK